MKSTCPKVSPARAAAFDILLRVERESSYASELLHSRTHDRLTRTDHALATELVMGVLRWRSLLDTEIVGSSAQPLAKLDLEILTTLRLGLYQLRWLRTPARAAINESVELVKRARKRSAAPFVNAVLRKLSTANGLTIPTINNASAETLALSSAHPLWLVERWVQAYGLTAAVGICQHNQSIPVTAIRFHDSDEQAEVEDEIRAEGIELAPGALLSSTRQVRHGDITKTAAFRAGLCMIQDEASQLVASLVGQGTHILDCCAAPGGKTAAIADANPQADIVAVDLHPHRARLLKRLLGLDHSGAAGTSRKVSVLVADARNLSFAGQFDRVLADVPCSGTGTLSRNPEIKWRLALENLTELQARQIAILRSAMTQVASGGRLIYSTCSLEKEENEDVIARCLEENQSFRVIDCRIELERLKQEGTLVWSDLSSLTREHCLRTLPGIHPCDGFFAAVLERI
ncbi:MAG: 16S rRNA (cytosine(967)-C(5))-methyltransferase RsmB [Candidatus Sulfotelmatobacter sp.]